jgi:hypothetical protein
MEKHLTCFIRVGLFHINFQKDYLVRLSAYQAPNLRFGEFEIIRILWARKTVSGTLFICFYL